MKKTIWLAIMAAWASIACAQFPGVLPYDIETTKYIPNDIPLRRGETKVLQFRFLQDGTAISIPNTATALLNYKAIGATGGFNVATGYVYSTTGGMIRVLWTSALNPPQRVSDYDVTVYALTATLCRAFGRLNLDSQVSVGTATGNPGRITLIDWNTVVNSNVGSAPFLSTMNTGGVTRIDSTADIESSGDGTGVQSLTLSAARLASLAKADAALTNAADFDPAGSAAGVSNSLAPGASAGLTAVQPATLAGYVETGRTVTINGTAGNLSSNLDFTIAGGTGGGDVASVNGQTGAVVLTAGDVGAFPTSAAFGVTTLGGFFGGTGSDVSSATYGGAIGNSAVSLSGGSVGSSSSSLNGGAIGDTAFSVDGGAIGLNAKTGDGFAGGKNAFATTDGTASGTAIDAIQLGEGGNIVERSFQVYTNVLLDPNGHIPIMRLTGIASNQIDAATDAAYRSGGGTSTGGVTSAQVSNIVNAATAQWATNPATGPVFIGTNALIFTWGGKTNVLTFNGTNFISIITP